MTGSWNRAVPLQLSQCFAVGRQLWLTVQWRCPGIPFAPPSCSCTATAKSLWVIFLRCNKGFHGEEGRTVRGNGDSFKCVFLLQRNSVSKFTLGDQGLCNGWVMGRSLVNFSPNLNSPEGSYLPCPHFLICEDHFIGICYSSSTQIITAYKHAMGLLHFSTGIPLTAGSLNMLS